VLLSGVNLSQDPKRMGKKTWLLLPP